MAQKIRTTPSLGKSIKIGGKLDGRKTHLIFSDRKGSGIVLEGQKLLRLARAIVEQMETRSVALDLDAVLNRYEF